jgi:hypothetical protein
MEFPEGMTVAQGRFTLRALLRGEPLEGLWSASEGARDAAAWVTLRCLRASPDRNRILRFSSYGIEAPLYIGAPDIEAEHRDYYFCVVDAAPTGTALARAGRLSEREGARLGVALCDVVASWAAGSAGMIFAGLHPETVYLDERRRFVCAVPRPHLLLGLQDSFYGDRNISFAPPGYSGSLMGPRDAVFTVALLVWWAVAGAQPYVIAGTDAEANAFNDRRVPFDGPAVLGAILDRALVADPDRRIGLDELRTAFGTLAG